MARPKRRSALSLVEAEAEAEAEEEAEEEAAAVVSRLDARLTRRGALPEGEGKDCDGRGGRGDEGGGGPLDH